LQPRALLLIGYLEYIFEFIDLVIILYLNRGTIDYKSCIID